LRPAISRLGYRALHNLVMAVTLTKLFQADSIHVSRRLKKLWEHSRQVAANSYVLASMHKHLRPDEAMLAGLVHDIGALPLYIYADRHHMHLSDDALEELSRMFGGTVGEKLLRHWNFSDELVEVIQGHEDMQRTGNQDRVDYVDIVTIANLQMPATVKFVDWSRVAVIEKLGLGIEDCQNFLQVHQEQLAKVLSMFWIGAPGPQPKPSRAADTERVRPVAAKSKRMNTGLWHRILRFFQ
jgi:HD-like signal output (HDOD) protein